MSGPHVSLNGQCKNCMEIMVLMTSVPKHSEHQRVPETGKHNLLHIKPRNTLFNSGFINWIALAIQFIPLSAHNTLWVSSFHCNEDCIICCSWIGKDGCKNCGGRIQVAIHGCTSHSCKPVTQLISCVALLQK